MSINIVFQEKGKQNVIVQGKQKMPFSELIQIYYKKICASKKDKMTKKYVFQGNELSPEEGTLLTELGIKDYSVVEVNSTEPMTSAPHEVPKQEEPPKEEPPQEEPPAEEGQPQEEHVEEEQPQEEQAAEEQPAEEQPAEEQNQDNDEWD